MPIPRGMPFARGHTTKALLGTRLVVPGDARQNAITPAGGFVSTASDVARYFAQLAPGAKRSVWGGRRGGGWAFGADGVSGRHFGSHAHRTIPFCRSFHSSRSIASRHNRWSHRSRG